jgi:hypothetical protein
MDNSCVAGKEKDFVVIINRFKSLCDNLHEIKLKLESSNDRLQQRPKSDPCDKSEMIKEPVDITGSLFACLDRADGSCKAIRNELSYLDSLV